MAYRYTAGETTEYLGFEAQNSNEILTEMVRVLQIDTVQSNSVNPWIIDNQISSGNHFTCQGRLGDYPCFLKVTDDTSNNEIVFEGASDNTYTTFSSPFRVPYDPTNPNRIHFTCSDSFLALKNYRLNQDDLADGAFFGFLDDRRILTDQYAVIVADMEILRCGFAEIMKDFFTETIDWYKIYSAFRDASTYEMDSSLISSSDVLITDWVDPEVDNIMFLSSTGVRSTANSNPTFRSHNGARNKMTNLPEIGRVRIREGRLSEVDQYGDVNTLAREGRELGNYNIATRGYIPDIIIRGLSSYTANQKAFPGSVDGIVYSACGVGKLGMRING